MAQLELDMRFLDVERLGPVDPGSVLPFAVVVNRVSDAAPPALARYVTSVLSLCESHGVPTVNGAMPYAVATSKVAQHGIFSACGLR
eukprot:CAMPEP_0176135604 /NCGR_PEP_ID=MMETSP0120_2-20121206/68796_1 /TAXON_ID=160619 /ORGANISM="Kryptoperidinium foliaceum, Strain CCMP 1326" /LENGTH=86 /DNA_ID=CAMNT_0017471325 /DNA_START=18 /DNA_END=274 /DNA_ORIENTATION=-